MPSSASSSPEPRSPRPEEAGFTILETMVVLAVCSIALFSLWALSLRLGTAFSKAGNSGAAAVKAATLDRALRALCARTEFPFWAKNPEDAFSDGRASIPFFDGDPGSSLVVKAVSEPGSASKRVVLEAGKTSISLDGFDEFEAEPFYSDDGRLAGILAVYSCGREEYRTRALFAAWSLLPEKAE